MRAIRICTMVTITIVRSAMLSLLPQVRNLKATKPEMSFWVKMPHLSVIKCSWNQYLYNGSNFIVIFSSRDSSSNNGFSASFNFCSIAVSSIEAPSP